MTALTAGSARLVAWFTPGEMLRSTAAWSIKWRDLGRVNNVAQFGFGRRSGLLSDQTRAKNYLAAEE